MTKSEGCCLVELEVVGGGSVPPGGLVGHLGAAQRARVLAVQPGRDAELAEDVAAAEPHRRAVVVVADGARLARGHQLLACGLRAQVLEMF